jgi:hypothetical protein
MSLPEYEHGVGDRGRVHDIVSLPPPEVASVCQP